MRYFAIWTLAVCGMSASATAGVSVTVNFSGPVPTAKKIEMKADPYCAKHAADDPSVLVKAGRLQNVVVRIVKGVPAAPGQGEVVIDQHHCMYQPRIVAAAVGQTVVVKNSDATLHNVHTYMDTQTLFNRAQPPGKTTIRQALADKDAGRVIRFGCDVHAWMGAYVVVVDNPHYAVTNSGGTAELTLPPGNYTLETWHERYGSKQAKVTVPAGGNAAVSVTYTGTEEQPTL